MPTRCCISYCRNSRANPNVEEHVKYHRFPQKDKEQLKLWCAFLGPGYTHTKSHRICSWHFEPTCYYRHLNTVALKQNAVPSVKQPLPGMGTTVSSYKELEKNSLPLSWERSMGVEEACSAEDVDIKDEVGIGMDTKEPVAIECTPLLEFVDIRIKQEVEEDTDTVDARVVLVEDGIKKEPEDDDPVGTEFIDVDSGPAAMPILDQIHGVLEPLCKVEVPVERDMNSSYAVKTSDPLEKPIPTVEGTTLPICPTISSILSSTLLGNNIFSDSCDVISTTEPYITEDGYVCRWCSKTFKKRKSLTRHIKTHSVIKPYACEECGMAFTSKDYLTKHVQVHSRKWPFTCDECDKSFRCSTLLAAHSFAHSGKKLYSCQQCERSFANKYNLTKHMRRSHMAAISSCSALERVFVCEHCGKCWGTDSALKQHMACHTRGRPFHCDTCGKSFPTKNYLKQHIMIHTGERLYSCVTCKRGFITRSELKKHTRSHTGEKPFACPLCDKRFSCKPNLTRHLSYHSGRRPHICFVCDKSFTEKNNLIRHQRSHHKVTSVS